MSEEEMQKKMEFIIEQQAQFATDIQILRETQAADSKLLKEKHNSLADALMTVVGMVGKLAAQQEQTAADVARLAASQAELSERLNELSERLNIFINVVERYIVERRSGGNGGNGANDDA